MNIQLISVGKIREKYLKAGIAEFEKRLQPYCKLTMTELADEQAPEQLSEKELQRVKDKEDERIIQCIIEVREFIARDIMNDIWSYAYLAQVLYEIRFEATHQRFGITGKINGLFDIALKPDQETPTFSNMTHSHPMKRLILLDEVYS